MWQAKVYPKLGLIVRGVATKDKPLGRRGVGWHTVVCYGAPEMVPSAMPSQSFNLPFSTPLSLPQ
jgi:hypothetical protein